MKVTLHAQAFIDRRSLDLHCRYDHILRERWRISVARNIKERRRIERLRLAALERGVANMGSSGQGQIIGASSIAANAKTRNRPY